MKLWLCGDHHTGTTYFYETFLKLAIATNEKYFTTTATKEFVPNHMLVDRNCIPQTFPNNYSSSSPLIQVHTKFLEAASNYDGSLRDGLQRLEKMFSCYSGVNLLISEPSNFNFDRFNFDKLHQYYNNLLRRHEILMVFIIRNPVDLECSRWVRKLTRFMNTKNHKYAEKSRKDVLLKNYLINQNYLDKIEQTLKKKGEFVVDYFPVAAASTTRSKDKKADTSYYQYYGKLIQYANHCENIKITTYESLFADVKRSTKNMIKYLSPTGLENADLSLEIDSLNTNRVNSSNHKLICSEKIKDKMRMLHPEGFNAWNKVSQTKGNNSLFLP